jgi:hypothetical protein
MPNVEPTDKLRDQKKDPNHASDHMQFDAMDSSA